MPLAICLSLADSFSLSPLLEFLLNRLQDLRNEKASVRTIASKTKPSVPVHPRGRSAMGQPARSRCKNRPVIKRANRIEDRLRLSVTIELRECDKSNAWFYAVNNPPLVGRFVFDVGHDQLFKTSGLFQSRLTNDRYGLLGLQPLGLNLQNPVSLQSEQDT